MKIPTRKNVLIFMFVGFFWLTVFSLPIKDKTLFYYTNLVVFKNPITLSLKDGVFETGQLIQERWHKFSEKKSKSSSKSI